LAWGLLLAGNDVSAALTALSCGSSVGTAALAALGAGHAIAVTTDPPIGRMLKSVPMAASWPHLSQIPTLSGARYRRLVLNLTMTRVRQFDSNANDLPPVAGAQMMEMR
jgi:hypothetical protein